jgi:aminomethyltransferase
MPLMYTSVAEEHLAVREAVGLFDVSHMGEFSVRGLGAVDFLQHVTSNDVARLPVGGVQYSTILNERGGIKDDVLIHRIGEQEFIIVCNAVNVDKLNRWFAQHQHREVKLEDISPTTVMLALQGPKAQQILQPLTGLDLAKLKRYTAAKTDVASVPMLVSRSGYTGEDGFELFIFDESPTKPVRAEAIWKTMLQAGKDAGIKPCGIGARYTTRLEAGLCLYGNELTEDITPIEAKIGFVVRFDKGEFIGYAPLLEQKIVGPKHVRVGIRMAEAGVPRQGHEIFGGSEKVGTVTSGTFSPLLKVGIAMGYARPGLKIGDKISVEIRGKKRVADVVNWPFYDQARYGYLRR